MSDMTETLQDLVERRLNEIGKRRGRGESISLREAYQRLLDRAEAGEVQLDSPIPTYEVFRRIRKGHSSISDKTAGALATMLDVPPERVYAAAGVRPRLGRFELPPRADRLDDQQRQVIISVVDAILAAADQQPATPTELKQGDVVHFAGSGKSHNLARLIGALPKDEYEKVIVVVSNAVHQQGSDLTAGQVREVFDGIVHAHLDDVYEDLAARPTTE